MLDTNPMQYFIRAALAGIYIGFIIVLCFKLGNFFHIADSPATYLAASMFSELPSYLLYMVVLSCLPETQCTSL